MHENIVPVITAESGRNIDFDATLTVGESQIAVKVNLNDDGATLSTKKDSIALPRAKWLDAAVVNNALVLIVDGFGYDLWSKKRKFEKKNPGQEFSDFESKASLYSLTFKPKKLPEDVSLADLIQQTKRTYMLAYLDEMDGVENPVVIRCPDCKSAMDVTPLQADDNLFCDNCSRVIGVPDEPDRGICDSCLYYTKLVSQEKSELSGDQGSVTVARICHPCRVSQTFWGFVVAVAMAIGIGVLNFATLYFGNRYFPILILIGIGALLWSIFSLVKVIVYSLAQKATGGSPLANATAALRKGDTDKALEIIESLDGDMTGNPGILMNLTRGLITSGDYEKANQFADILTTNFPNFSLGHLEKINAMSGMGASAEELEALQNEAIAVGARNALRSPARARVLGKYVPE